MTVSSVFGAGFAAGAAGSRVSGFWTRYFAIFFSILMVMSELPVVAFLEGVEEIGGGMHFAVVLDLLVAPHLHLAAVLQREHVGRVLEVVLLDQHALERLRVEAEGGAAL